MFQIEEYSVYRKDKKRKENERKILVEETPTTSDDLERSLSLNT